MNFFVLTKFRGRLQLSPPPPPTHHLIRRHWTLSALQVNTVTSSNGCSCAGARTGGIGCAGARTRPAAARTYAGSRWPRWRRTTWASDCRPRTSSEETNAGTRPKTVFDDRTNSVVRPNTRPVTCRRRRDGYVPLPSVRLPDNRKRASGLASLRLGLGPTLTGPVTRPATDGRIALGSTPKGGGSCSEKMHFYICTFGRGGDDCLRPTR